MWNSKLQNGIVNFKVEKKTSIPNTIMPSLLLHCVNPIAAKALHISFKPRCVFSDYNKKFPKRISFDMIFQKYLKNIRVLFNHFMGSQMMISF